MTEIFEFNDLPLVVKDLITEKIVHELHPKERINFMLTSKTSKWLIERAKPPTKVYKKLDIFSVLGSSYINYGRQRITGQNRIILTTLDDIQISETFCFRIDDFYLEPDVIQILGKCVKFANHISIEGGKENLSMIDLIQHIYDYQEFRCKMPLPVHDVFKSLPNHKNITLEELYVNDDSLVLLAELTNERNPINYLNITSMSSFSVGGILWFLKTATFDNNATIKLQPINEPNSEYISMLLRLGCDTTYDSRNLRFILNLNDIEITVYLPTIFNEN
uniref:F-box domain-containing protein n=1 Tax=Panagrolaimus sp. JU765 TaxID=591449 RepID=A0AC34RKT1_9BILA